MKELLFDRIIKLYVLIKAKIDQKVIIFIIFLFISTIFWFLNALSREYSTDIRYPVRYINFPSDKILVNDLPSHFNLLVKSYGYNILKYKLRSNRKRIIINVKSYPIIKKEGTTSNYYILTNSGRDKISTQISSELQLLEIKPDSIIFEFADAVTKKVKVKPNIDVELEKQYMLKYKISSIPDSIEISGPNNIIDTIEYVLTKYQRFRKVNESIEKNISLIPNRHLIYSKKKVLITIPIDQYTESQSIVPIIIKNLPDSLNLKLFPNSVTFSYYVCLSDYSKLRNDLFEVFVNYNEINKNYNEESEFLDVLLGSYPEYVQSIRYKPNKVEYLIERND